MEDLFGSQENKQVGLPPLAERMRPQKLSDFIGQEHLIRDGMPFAQMLKNQKLQSSILWGPPGTGKTTLANLIAYSLNKKFFALHATQAGTKEIKETIDKSRYFPQPILFIDEIHRLNKTQQDALLQAVEKGIILLIGATTENPSFEITSALLSRCHVFLLNPLELHHIHSILLRAIQQDPILQQRTIQIQDIEPFFILSNGDARKALNLLDALSNHFADQNPLIITAELFQNFTNQKIPIYDKNGEQHYDIISAFIKSVRGSDPNAAVLWLAIMLDAGEDPLFIARRMIILASEDIGNANPQALVLANACFDAVHKIGMPEARIVLAQTATYLAASPKSNSAYLAIQNALELIKKTPGISVPLHLRNAPTQLLKNLHYGENYIYPHDFDTFDQQALQNYMPEELQNHIFYNPKKNGHEAEILSFLQKKWKGIYPYDGEQ